MQCLRNACWKFQKSFMLNWKGWILMMAMLWAQQIMSADTMEEAKELYNRVPRLLKAKVDDILNKSDFVVE